MEWRQQRTPIEIHLSGYTSVSVDGQKINWQLAGLTSIEAFVRAKNKCFQMFDAH